MAIQDVEGVKRAVVGFGVIGALHPAACAASQMRACGLRIVAEPQTVAALRELAASGDLQAEMIVLNLFPNGHPEVQASPAKKVPRRWWQFWLPSQS